MIRSFQEAHQALSAYYGPKTRGPYKLDRMFALLELLGNPQNNLKILHIAGTSGKTSTAYYAAALFKAAGYKVGLTVSPHVDELNERVQINLVPMPERQFCDELDAFLQKVEASGLKPSYFELMVTLAFWEFTKQQVDYAVIETGLGGLLDGTNTVSREDKACVITDIGYDHTEVLGETLYEIAGQKAGILQPHNHLFMYEQSAEVMQAVNEAVAQKDATLHLVPVTTIPQVTDLPAFQRRNFMLAYQAVQFMLERDGRPALSEPQLLAATRAYIPARMEEVVLASGTLIIDGAHNYQKLGALIDSIHSRFGDQPVAAVLAFVDGEPSRWQRALDAIMPQLHSVTFTSYAVEQDVPKRAVDPALLAAYCADNGLGMTVVEPDPAKAFAQLLAAPETIKLVTGSFYLLNEIRPLVRQMRSAD